MKYQNRSWFNSASYSSDQLSEILLKKALRLDGDILLLSLKNHTDMVAILKELEDLYTKGSLTDHMQVPSERNY